MTSLQTWLTFLPMMVLKQLPLDPGKMRNWMRLTFMPKAVRSILKQGASNAVDDPGGSVDDPGGSGTDDVGSFSNLATSTTTSPKTSVSFVSSSLTNRVSLLSLLDKSTVDVMGNVDVGFGLWRAGVGCAMYSYDNDYGG